MNGEFVKRLGELLGFEPSICGGQEAFEAKVIEKIEFLSQRIADLRMELASRDAKPVYRARHADVIVLQPRREPIVPLKVTCAVAVAQIIKTLYPKTYEVFEEHTLYGVRLSRTERVFLYDLLAGTKMAAPSKQLNDILNKLNLGGTNG